MDIKIHELKILPEYYCAVKDGIKTFEIRKNDRFYEEGDILVLQEWNGDYTGRILFKTVTYVLNDNRYLQDGYVALGLD